MKQPSMPPDFNSSRHSSIKKLRLELYELNDKFTYISTFYKLIRPETRTVFNLIVFSL